MYFAIYKTNSFVSKLYTSEDEEKILTFIENKLAEMNGEKILVGLYKQAEGEKITIFENKQIAFDPKKFFSA